MSTKKKNTAARGDAGGSLLLAVLASPLGWLADDRPVALRDRAPHGDDSDSLGAQVSALVWGLALLVVAVLVAPVLVDQRAAVHLAAARCKLLHAMPPTAEVFCSGSLPPQAGSGEASS